MLQLLHLGFLLPPAPEPLERVALCSWTDVADVSDELELLSERDLDLVLPSSLPDCDCNLELVLPSLLPDSRVSGDSKVVL